MKRIIPVIVLVAGLSVLYPLQKWIDTNLPREAVDEDTIYLTSGDTIRRMSLGMRGLAANIYWIRTTQYFGDKLMKNYSATSTRSIPMKLLPPLLDIVVKLDPQQTQACRFGAIFLAERDFNAAVRLLEYGFRENPNQWRLCQDLGFIYWQVGNYEKAAEWYERGADIPGSRDFMRTMVGLMKVRGGRREEARAIYTRYYESDDPAIKAHAYERLKQIQSLDEMDAINKVLAQYHEQTKSCPASLRQLARKWHSMGLSLSEDLDPVDPNGFPYSYDPTNCKVGLHPKTTLAR
jgi:tetratricopeptide (TPR) repeat protein